MTIGTVLCPRCGQNNALNSTSCARCKITLHSPLHSQFETGEDDYEDENYGRATPLPWIMAGFGFVFIAVLLFLNSNRSGAELPRSFAFFQPFSGGASQPPPELSASSATTVVVAPRSPGNLNQPKTNWQPVAEFSGAGASRLQPFSITSSYWRVRWQAKTANSPANVSNGAKPWFYAFIYRNDGKRLERITNTETQGSNTLRLEKSGTYYVEVNATQEWSLKIEEWR